MAKNSSLKKIDKLLKKRHKSFPQRVEPQWSNLLKEINCFAKQIKNQVKKEKLKPPEKKIYQQGLKIINRPVFIAGYYKSGTSLLLSLLDNHPQLVALTDESVYFSLFLPKYGHLPRQKKIDQLVDLWLRKLITPSGKPPFWILEKTKKGYQQFVNNFYWLTKKQAKKDLLALVALAYFLTTASSKLETDFKVKYWLEKTPTNEFYLQQIVKLYPQAKFIHLLRDPRSIIASIQKLEKEKSQSKGFVFSLKKLVYFFYHLIRIKRSFSLAFKNQAMIGKENYLVVSYEELVKQSEKTVKRVADFLKIKYLPILLKPTTAGRSMIANSAWNKGRVKGRINQQSLRQWEKELSKIELSLINLIVGRVGSSWGYDLKA